MNKIKTSKKEHRCDTCGRLIPIGVKYWADFDDTKDIREHTNCLEFEKQPVLDFGFNQNRYKIK